jgi:Fe2+ transport system protein FeoA
MDLGFLPGTTVVKEYTGAAGDPIAFLVRGSLMALRRSQAEYIFVDPVASGEPDRGAQPMSGGAS